MLYLRIIALAVLFGAFVMPDHMVRVFQKSSDIQIVATFVVASSVFIDVSTGLMLLLAVGVTLIRAKFDVSPDGGEVPSLKGTPIAPTAAGEPMFTTAKDLKNASTSGIYDPDHFDEKYKGMNGVYGESVVSAQGFEGMS